MTPLISFHNVSFFPKEEFGLERINFTLNKSGRYLIRVNSEENVKSLLGIIENRFQQHSGIINRDAGFFLQSDHLLLGDQLYDKEVGSWLALCNDGFFFKGKKCSKFNYLNLYKARQLRYFPIYKLRGLDRIKFTLLALTFQEAGLILINELLKVELPEDLVVHFKEMIAGTRCCVCLVINGNQAIEEISQLFGKVTPEIIDLTSAKKEVS